MRILGLDHVQLAMPPGEEAAARAFYGGVLLLAEVPKPPELSGRGGVWFRGDGVEIHLGGEPDFRPSAKAHPAFLVDDLEGFVSRYEQTGRAVTRDKPLPGQDRVHLQDPFGNRIELLQRHPGRS